MLVSCVHMSMPPVISVVVPNFNGAATLADTLASLVEQDYPHKEILVVDGGSTDASVHIIQRYAEHIAWWVSEKDNGQSSAINKGLARAKGQVVNWLCSDDRLEKGACAPLRKHLPPMRMSMSSSGRVGPFTRPSIAS